MRFPPFEKGGEGGFKGGVMKKIFQFSLGQMILIVTSLFLAGFLIFYLGAKLGPSFFWGIELGDAKNADMLPDKLTEEQLNALLADEGEVPITFHQELENKTDSAPVIDARPEEKIPVVAEVPVAEDLPPSMEEKVSKALPPKPEPKAVVKPKPVEVAVAVPRYTLKVGSFSSFKEAQALAMRFQQKGFSSRVETVQIPDKGNWYRVHVGRYSTNSEAAAQKAQIERTTGIMPVIVSL